MASGKVPPRYPSIRRPNFFRMQKRRKNYYVLNPKQQPRRRERLKLHVKKPSKQPRKQNSTLPRVPMRRHPPVVEGYSRILCRWGLRGVEAFRRRLEVYEVEVESDGEQGEQASLGEKAYEDAGR
jgi:hypothetical protein